MGPLANARRITAMESFIGDATQKGATVRTGGSRIGNKGNFFEPTVLTDVPMEARVQNEEPFGPLAIISPFRGFDDVVAEANRLPFGLASSAGWYTPLFTAFVTYSFFGLDALSEELEEPFGIAENDLALDGLCRVCEISVFEALGEVPPKMLIADHHRFT